MHSFFKAHGGASWVCDSYDDWVFGKHSPIPGVVRDLRPARTKDGVEVMIVADGMQIREIEGQTPSLCRLNREMYAYEIWVYAFVNGQKRHEMVCLGKFPRMVKDAEDAGHFIIDGMDRAYVNRESMRYEYPRYAYFHPKSKRKGEEEVEGTYEVDMTSLDAKFTVSYSTHKNEIRAHIGFVSNQTTVPIWRLLRALGEKRTPVQIWPKGEPGCDAVRDAVRAEEEEEDALYAIGKALMKSSTDGVSMKRTKSYAEDAMHARVLPFLYDAQEKREYLEDAMRELMLFFQGKRKATDTNSMEYKRIDTAGNFIARLVKNGICDMWNMAVRKFSQTVCDKDIERMIDSEALGAFVSRGMKVGLDAEDKSASMLPRKASWQESLSTIRRVSANIGTAAFVAGPRMFDGTWYAFYCVCETQEGDRTGLTRETAVFFKCSPHGDAGEWKKWIREANLNKGEYTVRVNQSVAVRGVDAAAAFELCKQLKRTRDPYASVVLASNHAVLYVDVSEGRAMRPIWIRSPDIHYTGEFKTLIEEGRVEWIDAAMCRRMIIHTDVERGELPAELDACALYGASAANIPFANRNAGSRNLFAAHVRHQAVGFPHPFAKPEHPKSRKHDRFDTEESASLWYPQRALCDTKIAREMQSHVYPNGWNAVIFILAHSFGQEDAIGIAQRHIDLGAGSIQSEISVKETVEHPNEWFGCVMKKDTHPKVDFENGLPRVGETIFPGDVFLCKRNAERETETIKWRKKFPVRVQSVVRTKNHMVMIRFTWRRTPEIGDKLATRHGQKGVLSFILQNMHLWWTSSGMTPDLVMSPAAFPTRMTMGHIMEMLCGKANSLAPPVDFTHKGCEGTPTDCTPYSNAFDYAEIQNILSAHGFQRKGHEVVYNGTTGEIMRNCHVYVGPAFVQRLTHYAFTKSYARGRGARNPQTGQPPKGRRNDGGLRIGEGENKATQAHGAASSQRTMSLECSDGIEVKKCAQCTEIGTSVKCVQCGTYPCYPQMKPRAFLLMRDQLRVAHINAEL